MQVLANDFKRLWEDCQQDYTNTVSKVGESGWYILGSEVAMFEQELATYTGCQNVVGVANGMDAIEIGLRILNVGPGDKVLTTPLSAFATGLAIMRARAQPVYCDVDAHGALDPVAVKTALEMHPDIKCIIPVHLFGHMANIEQLALVAKEYNVPIIEDAAQAVGASRNGIKVGAEGRTACYSFYPTKNLGAVGDGGALSVGNDAHAETARAMRNYGQTEKYVHDIVGLNSRLDELHAATLRATFLPRFDGWLAARRRIAKAYLTGITNPNVVLLPGPDHNGSVWHLFPIMVAKEQRDAFLATMQDAGIQVGLHYPILIPHQKAVTGQGDPIIAGTLKTAQTFANQEVSLPIHPYLSNDEIAFVVETVNAWAG